MELLSRMDHALPSIERRDLIAPSDGARYRRLTLEIDADGSLLLTSHALGGSLEAAWGLDDEEITVRVPASHLPRLAMAAAAQCLQGRPDAAEAMIELCEANDVSFQAALWT